MSHLHLVRPGEDAREHRVSRVWAGFAAAVMVVVLVAGAFSVGARWGRGEAGIGGPGASSAPSGVPPAIGQVAMSAACTVAAAPADTRSGGVTRSRGGQLRCDTTSTDPRVTGTMTVFWSTDRRADGTGEAWGEATLRTPDGRWSGPFSGSVDANGTQRLTGALFGADAYAGQHIVFTQVGTSEAFVLQGQVQPADTPAAADTAVVRRLTCVSGADAGTEQIDPAGVTRVRGRSMTCAAEASDPRLTGELTLVARIDAQPDESARIGGTESLVNGGGAWLGTWDGTYDTGWTTHRWTGTVRGSAGYAGLEYRYATIGEWPRFIEVGGIVGGD